MIRKYGIDFMEQKNLDWYEKQRAEVAAKYPGIELDISKRWETGVEHHEKSVDLMKRVSELDFTYMRDYFGWKTGGDGDNGERLMYLFDIIFEGQDAGITQ